MCGLFKHSKIECSIEDGQYMNPKEKLLESLHDDLILSTDNPFKEKLHVIFYLTSISPLIFVSKKILKMRGEIESKSHLFM